MIGSAPFATVPLAAADGPSSIGLLAVASDEIVLNDEALAGFQALLQSVLTLAAEANGVLEMDAALADNVEFSDSVRAVLSLLLSDAIELEDSATSAGLVVTAENPQDGRRLLYHLAPAIPATKTERGWEMDFGYCLVRG